MDEYENSLCCMEAEQNIIWSSEYQYKKEVFPRTKFLKSTPDISHLHKDDWLFDYIPF